MKQTCTICGSSGYAMYAFKSGCICENCLQYLRTAPEPTDNVRINH